MAHHIIFWYLVSFLSFTLAQAPYQCAQIALYNECLTSARSRVDACGYNLKTGVPDVDFYDCQCKELTSVELCFWHCPDSPEIMAQLPNEQANARTWCEQASSFKRNNPSTTTSSTTTIKETKTVSLFPTFSNVPDKTVSKSENDALFTPFSTSATTLSTNKVYGPTATLDLTNGSQDFESISVDWNLKVVLTAFVILYVLV